MSRVAITGWGALTALGDHQGESLATTLASGVDPLVRETTVGGRSIAVARVPEPWPESLLEGSGNVRPIDRLGRLACAAARLALEDAAIGPEVEPRPGLVLGTLLGGFRTIAEFDRRAQTQGPMYASPLDFANSVINAAAGQTAIWHHLDGPNATIGGGVTAALQALGWAADLIDAGESRPLLTGGGEELAADTILGFEALGRLSSGEGPRPFDAHADGIALGEAAAFLVLEGNPESRGVPVRGYLRGAAGTFDSSLASDPVAARAALVRAIELALAQAEIAPRDIALVSSGASGGGDDGIEAAALLALAIQAPVIAVKSQLGECFGAGGALAAIVALEVLGGAPAPAIRGFESPASAAEGLRVVRAPTVLADGGRYALVIARGSDGASWAVVLEGAGGG